MRHWRWRRSGNGTVTDQVGRLTAVARDEGDFLGEQFGAVVLQKIEEGLDGNPSAGCRSGRGQPVRARETSSHEVDVRRPSGARTLPGAALIPGGDQ